MCYSRSTFLLGTSESPDFPLWPTEQTLGEPDTAKFDRWLDQETYMMEMAIGGNVEGDALQDYLLARQHKEA